MFNPDPRRSSHSEESIGVNRERAFVHAIVAAGIAHTLTKNCTAGDFGECGCDAKLTKRREEFLANGILFDT